MLFEAKNELQQYLSSINPNYAKYVEALWANGINSLAQLGNASVPGMHACGIENTIHAQDIIAQSKTPGKCSSVLYIVCQATCYANVVHYCPLCILTPASLSLHLCQPRVLM